MKKVHPYQHIRPRRVDVMPSEDLSYNVGRYAEDHDIRYSFGRCGKAEREHIQVVEIDFSWLGVVFHIVSTSECHHSPVAAITLAKDDIETVKDLAKQVIIRHLEAHPQKLIHILETVHEASREQGHLEVIKNALGSMSVKVDLSDRHV